jgi:ADP-dependent NAD(P)H-hydrate dehydratase
MSPLPPSETEQPAPFVRPVLITPALLRRWPLPQPDEGGGKDERGRVLILGGTKETPGGVILAAEAALRAGAGKLQISLGKTIAPWVAAAVPEARVVGLDETASGAFAPGGARQAVEMASKADAVVVGPGMMSDVENAPFLEALLSGIEEAVVIVDAGALSFVGEHPKLLLRLNGRAILTPHAGEMSCLLELEPEVLEADRADAAFQAARRFGAVTAFKGQETIITAPDGDSYLNRAGNSGLGTSGSGDVLAGVIAGLAARGAEPLQAAVWGVTLHAMAGDRLAERYGGLGFLARELPAEIPTLMAELGNRE